MNESMFVQAVGLARSGKKAEARDLLQQVLKVDRANEMAWLWYAECLDTAAERIQALETCIRLNPQAQRVRLSLSALKHGNPPDNDLGRTQPVFIGNTYEDEQKNGHPRATPLSAEDEWVLSAGSAVFTIAPDRVAPEEFARIQESTEAFLLKNPDMKPIFRRTEDWSEMAARPTSMRERRAAPKRNKEPAEDGSRSSARGAVYGVLLIMLMFALLVSAAIMLQVI